MVGRNPHHSYASKEVVMDNILEHGITLEIGKVNKVIRGKLATAIKNGDADLIFSTEYFVTVLVGRIETNTAPTSWQKKAITIIDML